MSVVDYHSIVRAECFSQFCCYFGSVDSCGRDCISVRLALPSMPWNFQRLSSLSVDFYYILFYCLVLHTVEWIFFCTTRGRLPPIFKYLHVARQLCCRGPKFIFSVISLSLVSVSLRHCQQSLTLFQLPSAQNITIKCFLLHPQCNCHHCCDNDGFIKMKCCASILWLI